MLDAKFFVKGCALIAKHIRTRADASWDDDDFTLKYVSFSDAFPEVNDRQFLWCCERWIQSQRPQEFLRFPTWNELMAPLYRCEEGLANRSWGPREGLPQHLQFSPEQLQLLPRAVRSVLPPPDPRNTEAYRLTGRARAPGPLLPEADPTLLAPGAETLLTEEQWANHLQKLEERRAERRAAAAEDPREGAAGGPVVRHPVQRPQPERGTEGRGAAEPGVSRGARAIQGLRIPRP